MDKGHSITVLLPARCSPNALLSQAISYPLSVPSPSRFLLPLPLPWYPGYSLFYLPEKSTLYCQLPLPEPDRGLLATGPRGGVEAELNFTRVPYSRGPLPGRRSSHAGYPKPSVGCVSRRLGIRFPGFPKNLCWIHGSACLLSIVSLARHPSPVFRHLRGEGLRQN
jgi:hypothetical protein